MIHDNGYRWHPFVELVQPVGQGAQWGNNKMRPKVVFLLAQERNQCNRLDSFAWKQLADGEGLVRERCERNIPRPISSARMPLIPWEQISNIQVRPSS